MLHGMLLITLFSLTAFYIGDIGFVKSLSFNPMIVGIILGMFYVNSLCNNLPDTWVPGVPFRSKRILRIGIILYGFRLTSQDATAVGLPVILTDAVIVIVIACSGVLIDKLLKMDQDIALLTSVGGGIYGVAVVLDVKSAINTKPYKATAAVSAVIIFGALSTFLYPVLYRNSVFNLSPELMGPFTDSTIHEVAHVVGTGNAMGQGISNIAIITKMVRVMMLAPASLVINWTVARNLTKRDSVEQAKGKITISWFVILFLAVIEFSLFNLLSVTLVGWINQFDTFLLTMAMTVLGAETSFDEFEKAGAKPLLLAVILFVRLISGDYYLAKYVVPVLMNMQGI